MEGSGVDSEEESLGSPSSKSSPSDGGGDGEYEVLEEVRIDAQHGWRTGLVGGEGRLTLTSYSRGLFVLMAAITITTSVLRRR
jgi:hypothetical protein